MGKKLLRILCVFFALPIFILNGCNDGEKPDYNLITDFSADFQATYRDSEYKGKISTNRQGVLSIDITYPQTLEGLGVRYYSGEMHLSRENIDSSADEAYLPDTSFPSVLKSVFDGINRGNTTIVSIGKEECERTLQVPMGNAIIISRDNVACRIRIEAIDFCIDFSNVNITE